MRRGGSAGVTLETTFQAIGRRDQETWRPQSVESAVVQGARGVGVDGAPVRPVPRFVEKLVMPSVWRCWRRPRRSGRRN